MYSSKREKAYQDAVQHILENCLPLENIVPKYEMRRLKWWQKKREIHVGYYILDETLTTSVLTIVFR